MSRFKMLALISFLSCVLVLYQNCAQVAPSPSGSSNYDDKVKKIDAPGDQNSDYKLVSDIQSLTVGENDQLAFSVEDCQKSMGSDRRNCLWERTLEFYEFLKSKDYSVSEEIDGCIFAISKSTSNLGEALDVISTCNNEDPSQVRSHVIHIGECLTSEGQKASAFINYKKSYYFEHARARIVFKTKGSKRPSLLMRDQVGTFIDACKNPQILKTIVVYKTVVVK